MTYKDTASEQTELLKTIVEELVTLNSQIYGMIHRYDVSEDDGIDDDN